MTMNMEDIHRYDDIIDMEHPDPKTHGRMSMHNRAAQFAPFAALTGYDEMVRDTTRANEERMDDRIEELCEESY